MFPICLMIRAIGMTKNNPNKIKVVATSVCGPMHCYKKLPCQDCFKHKVGGKNFVAVVSDGAGSAQYGKIGANIVCNTMVDLLSNCDFKNIKILPTFFLFPFNDTFLLKKKVYFIQQLFHNSLDSYSLYKITMFLSHFSMQ